jgi:hypothetical protein
MAAPRLWFTLILLCAIVIVAHQSAAPIGGYFAQRGGGRRKVVTLADLGQSFRPPASSVPGSGSSSGRGGGWKDALGGLFRSEEAGGGLFKEQAAFENKTLLPVSEALPLLSGGEDNAGAESVLNSSLEEEEGSAVMDWGMVADPLETTVSRTSPEETQSEDATRQGDPSTQVSKETASVWEESLEKSITGALGTGIQKAPKPPEGLTCREWMIEEWRRWEEGFRDFRERPVKIVDAGFRSWFETTEEELRGCNIGCELHAAGKIGFSRKPLMRIGQHTSVVHL